MMGLSCSRNSNRVDASKNIYLFIDGTGHGEEEQSNIAKLKNNLLKIDDRNVSAYYAGVGTEGKILGNAMGTGISEDIRDGYGYLSTHYKPGDGIYFFGFSRGAFTLRALAGMIHLFGLPQVKENEKAIIQDLVEEIYAIYNSGKSINEKLEVFRRKVMEWEEKEGVKIKFHKEVVIEAMGLFDTVEAIAWPDYKENYCCPSGNYLDQLCNVNRVYHAMALDDNRARIFTPNLLYCKCLEMECPNKQMVSGMKEEVWFAGAHSDVGGNNLNSTIPLNWMMEKFIDDHIFKSTMYKWDLNTELEDAESSNLVNRFLYKRMDRSITQYAQMYPSQAIPVHKSVIDRIEKGIEGYDSEWYRDDYFKGCFDISGDNVNFTLCDNIRIVYDSYFQEE